MFGDGVHRGLQHVEPGARASDARSGAESGTHAFPARAGSRAAGGDGVIRTAYCGAAIHGRSSVQRGYSAQRRYTSHRGGVDHSAQTASQNIKAARG
jgi:hypothetical protein